MKFHFGSREAGCMEHTAGRRPGPTVSEEQGSAMLTSNSFLYFWPHPVACRILTVQSGIKLTPSAMKVQGPNHWAIREFLLLSNFHMRKILLFQATVILDFPAGSDGKESVCNAGHPGWISELGKPLGERMATHSSILAWRIPWTEEPGWLQCMGLQRVGHD